METLIKLALKKEKDIQEIKIKTFSRTLNIKHNLKPKNFFILQIRPYFSLKYQKEKLYLKENCITYKLSENINIYYNIKQSQENLLNIIKEKTKYEFNYIIEKQKTDYNIYMTRKIMIQKGINKKKKSYFIKPINEFFDSINEKGMKSFSRKKSKKLSLKRNKKQKKNIILLKSNNSLHKDLIEKKEDFFLLKELNENIINKNINNKNSKIKAILKFSKKIKCIIIKNFFLK